MDNDHLEKEKKKSLLVYETVHILEKSLAASATEIKCIPT